MSESTQHVGGQPGDYLIEADGRINGWTPEGWTPTEEFASPAAVDMLQQRGASHVTNNTRGRPLYFDPFLGPVLRPLGVPRINGLASTARTLSFLGILIIPSALIGAICGHIALGQIKEGDTES